MEVNACREPIEHGMVSRRVDADVYKRQSIKEDGTAYHELLLVHVNNCLAINHDPKLIMELKSEKYELKNGTYRNQRRWSMLSNKYVRAAVETLDHCW